MIPTTGNDRKDAGKHRNQREGGSSNTAPGFRRFPDGTSRTSFTWV